MAENQALDRLLNILKTSGADAWEVTDIREKGWEEDFVILVMGDHLARMPRVDAIDLKHVQGRYVLCSLSRPDGLVPNRSEITHFDLFPSLLAALGFSVKGDRLGFGYNVFSRTVMPPSDYLETLRKNVLSRSPTYERLWFPEQRPKP